MGKRCNVTLIPIALKELLLLEIGIYLNNASFIEPLILRGGNEMSKMKFTIIELGTWDVPRNEIIAPETPEIAAENRRHTIPGYAILIDHPEFGKILYDTGSADDWEETWNDTMKSSYTWHSKYPLTDKLAELGLTVNDIDMLIVSHLHYDHAGNIKLFNGTKAGKNVIISKQEAQEAFVAVNLNNTGFSGAYWKCEFLEMDGIGYELIDKSVKLSDDLELFIQVGHTPGVIGLILKTEKDGNFIVTSDAIYSSKNFGPPIVLPGLCVDPVSYRANIEWVTKTSKALNAEVIFSHDVDNFKAYKKSPVWYE